MERKDSYAPDSKRWNPYHEAEIDYLVKLASKNVTDGVLEEPRVYYDLLTLTSQQVNTVSNPDVFSNGEQFPVHVTGMSIALQPDFAQNVGMDERLIQRVGLRLRYHDNFYQSSELVPAPLWANKVVAAPALTSSGVSSYSFERPVILSARDALAIEVALASAPATPRRVSCSVTGTGLLSKRPYFFSSVVDLATTTKAMLPIEGLRNDGAEPIALTDMTFHCGAEEADASGAGDIRQLAVQVHQVGNGTQADWFVGANSPVPIPQCPAVLLGKTAGRAIIHELPGQGFLWEPGEGLTIEALPLDASALNVTLAVALHGYLVVT